MLRRARHNENHGRIHHLRIVLRQQRLRVRMLRRKILKRKCAGFKIIAKIISNKAKIAHRKAKKYLRMFLRAAPHSERAHVLRMKWRRQKHARKVFERRARVFRRHIFLIRIKYNKLALFRAKRRIFRIRRRWLRVSRNFPNSLKTKRLRRKLNRLQRRIMILKQRIIKIKVRRHMRRTRRLRNKLRRAILRSRKLKRVWISYREDHPHSRKTMVLRKAWRTARRRIYKFRRMIRIANKRYRGGKCRRHHH